MSGPWHQEQAAVAAAIDAIGGLQERISVATEACDVAVGAILGCTGASNVESAVNAMNMIQGVKDRLDEIFGATQTAVEEMERYGRGF